MKLVRYAPLFAVAFTIFSAASAYSQASSFRDEHVTYSFELPDEKWKMTVKPSATSPNVEYVFSDRRDGHLEVRKLTVGKNAILTDIIRDEEQKLQFLPGYVAGKEESFSGKLRGSIFNYEFVRTGRNMSGRFYFLRANENTVYVLRFTGERDKLRSIRHHTDSIARTFGIRNS